MRENNSSNIGRNFFTAICLFQKDNKIFFHLNALIERLQLYQLSCGRADADWNKWWESKNFADMVVKEFKTFNKLEH
jgi:hypothetical protein